MFLSAFVKKHEECFFLNECSAKQLKVLDFVVSVGSNVSCWSEHTHNNHLLNVQISFSCSWVLVLVVHVYVWLALWCICVRAAYNHFLPAALNQAQLDQNTWNGFQSAEEEHLPVVNQLSICPLYAQVLNSFLSYQQKEYLYFLSLTFMMQ